MRIRLRENIVFCTVWRESYAEKRALKVIYIQSCGLKFSAYAALNGRVAPKKLICKVRAGRALDIEVKDFAPDPGLWQVCPSITNLIRFLEKKALLLHNNKRPTEQFHQHQSDIMTR